MFKKLLCLILCFLFITACAASCSDEPKESDQTDSDVTAGESDLEDLYSERYAVKEELPDETYDGYDFRVYLRIEAGNNTDFIAEKETGDTVNDAVYTRNLVISERFDINIIFNYDESGNTTYTTTAVNAILADEDANDLLALHGAFAFNHAKEGYVVDWKTELPYIDLEKPWWDHDFSDNMAIAGRLYAMTGDISYLSIGATFCLVFNKNLFNEYLIEYPYKDVIAGNWTFEKFASIVKASSIDLSGDSKQTPGEDLYGLVSGIWGMPIFVFYSAGDRVITIDEEGVPELTLYNERTVDIFNKFFDLVDNYNVHIDNYSPAYNGDMFRANRAMFSAASMGTLVSLRDMESDIGIIPSPKYDESVDRYNSLVDAGQNVFAVPITVSDYERTSVIIEALAAEGYRNIVPVFYEEALQIKYARDDESSEMLDIIRGGRIFDYGYYDATISWDLSYIGRNLIEQKNHDFASYYDARQKQATKSLSKLYDQYLG